MSARRFVMQVLIIAVQNAVDYRELGVATSNAILFRFIGGSLGAALLGAVLATQLDANASASTMSKSTSWDEEEKLTQRF
ncbi:MAG TPA: hypothetical protein VFR78_07785 [Pyrinomonadaceae bacterium]|nr:hypothetical protein [Pyrinomonadaceae bacterium]